MFLICSENYKRIRVYENGITDRNARYSILALRADGEFIKKEFVGFVDKSSLFQPQFVKLVNIVGVHNGMELIDIPKDHWVLGVYHRYAFSLVLEKNHPLYHPIEYKVRAQRYENNVVNLMSYKK